MALVKRRVSNPSPAILTLVNGGKMTRRRKRRTRRRAAAANPPRRRRRATVRSRRSVSLFKPRRRRARRANMSHRRRRIGTRRRNPMGGGIVGEAINFAVAGFAIGAAQPIIARFVPNFGTFTVPVTSVATGFGLAWLAGFANFTRPFKRPLQIMGFALAITTLAGPLVRQIMGGVQSGMSGQRRRNGMRGIAAVTGIPPQIVPPPIPPANSGNANGISGIAMRPGSYAY